MASHYRNTLESLVNGDWPVVVRPHLARDAAKGDQAAAKCLELGDVLWATKWSTYNLRARLHNAEGEVDGLRNTVQQLTDTLLARDR